MCVDFKIIRIKINDFVRAWDDGIIDDTLIYDRNGRNIIQNYVEFNLIYLMRD